MHKSTMPHGVDAPDIACTMIGMRHIKYQCIRTVNSLF